MNECDCQACQDLKAECGSNFTWLSAKLLHKGWAGKTSPAEKAYQRAHATWGKPSPEFLAARPIQKASR